MWYNFFFSILFYVGSCVEPKAASFMDVWMWRFEPPFIVSGTWYQKRQNVKSGHEKNQEEETFSSLLLSRLVTTQSFSHPRRLALLLTCNAWVATFLLGWYNDSLKKVEWPFLPSTGFKIASFYVIKKVAVMIQRTERRSKLEHLKNEK